jgi:hypothetical protein
MDKLVFISHSSEDASIARDICKILEKSGINCWIAPRDVRPGFNYDEEILEGINTTKSMVIVLSEHSNESVFVKREVERAITYRKEIYTIRIQDIKPSKKLEFFLSTVHWIDAFSSSLENEVINLASILNQSLEPKKISNNISCEIEKMKTKIILRKNILMLFFATV